jgi:SAM-dependent methyltransferase
LGWSPTGWRGPGYADEYFDYIVLPDVIEHFMPEDRDFYVNELKRILKKDGKILTITPSIDTMKVLEFIDTTLLKLVGRTQVVVVKNPKNFFFSKKELVDLYEKNGMQKIEYTKICFYPAPERSGFFGVVEQGFLRIGLQKIFFPIFYFIFWVISGLTICNQKMFLVTSKK